MDIAAIEKVPEGHSSTQVAAACTEYLPASQSWQVVAAEAPTVSEYLPASQSWQVVAAEAPTVSEYFPTSHAVQGFPPLTYSPVPSVYLPAGQEVQLEVDNWGPEYPEL